MNKLPRLFVDGLLTVMLFALLILPISSIGLLSSKQPDVVKTEVLGQESVRPASTPTPTAQKSDLYLPYPFNNASAPIESSPSVTPTPVVNR
ncbi:MAG TPA: hypothetical protein VLI92_03375 [Candidatus Saccharimonadales bacterium]|nr:hypothetical protein [Candidatus Saccharimonadales bacterium]